MCNQILRRSFEIGRELTCGFNYIKIPRSIIETYYNEPLSLQIFSYLYIHRGLNDIANTSILQLTGECGYKPDRHKGKIKDRIVSVLEDFKACGYISFNEIDLKCGSTLLPISININYFDSPSSFAMVWLDELEKMRTHNLDNDERRVKPEYLLLLLAHIRVNQMRRKNHDDTQKFPEVFYKQHKLISQETSLPAGTLKRCISILEQLDIIITAPLDRYQDPSGRWHTNVTVFADKYGDWESEIQNGIRLLKSRGSISKTKKGTNCT